MPETSIVPLVQLWRKYAEFAPSTGREPGPAEPPTLVDQCVAWLVHFPTVASLLVGYSILETDAGTFFFLLPVTGTKPRKSQAQNPRWGAGLPIEVDLGRVVLV
jgi:hypothetical protein